MSVQWTVTIIFILVVSFFYLRNYLVEQERKAEQERKEQERQEQERKAREVAEKKEQELREQAHKRQQLTSGKINTYSNYSYGKIHFKLPTGLFNYQGIQDGDAVYYGKNIPGNICCDVIISKCGFELMDQYRVYDTLLNMDPASCQAMIKQVFPYDIEISRGRNINTIETITNGRTLTLYVKAGAGSYFSLTVGKSLDNSVSISKLCDFAYEIVSSIKIDGVW